VLERNQPRHAAWSHGTNGLVIWWLQQERQQPQDLIVWIRRWPAAGPELSRSVTSAVELGRHFWTRMQCCVESRHLALLPPAPRRD
jgi:hypothetical protein